MLHMHTVAQAALNIDNSVSRIGFYGPQRNKLWCLSHTETLHLWEWVAACDEESAGVSISTAMLVESSVYLVFYLLPGQFLALPRSTESGPWPCRYHNGL